jgi:hypothetical protein
MMVATDVTRLFWWCESSENKYNICERRDGTLKIMVPDAQAYGRQRNINIDIYIYIYIQSEREIKRKKLVCVT